MLRLAVEFFILSLIAAFLGFGGVSLISLEAARLFFFLFFVLFVISLFVGVYDKMERRY